MSTHGFGVDIGGSGIKGAPVDCESGKLLQERLRIATPIPSTPHAVADVVAQVVHHFGWNERLGVTFPAVVKGGVIHTAANVDRSWIGAPAAQLFSDRVGAPCVVLNDADAAGIAEMHFGAGRDHHKGVVIMITLGTGIGCAVFNDGVLVPNTELGHLEVDGRDAEKKAAASARERDKVSFKQWGKRVDKYLQMLERLLWPDLLIIGGGVSEKFSKFSPYLHTTCPIVPAQLLNDAGIVGAAMAALGASGGAP